jgi:hypothetical protein
MARVMWTRSATWAAVVGVSAAVGATASAAPFTPASLHLAGDFNGWNAAGQQLTDTDGDGTFTTTVTGLTPGTRHEFKLTNGTWNDGGNIPGANSWFYADDAETTISFTPSPAADGWSPVENRIALSEAPLTWTAAGNFQSEMGGSDWDNASPFTAMTPVGGGVFQLDVHVPAGTYAWKAVVTGSWDSISWDTRSVGTADWSFTLAGDEWARLSVNPLAGTSDLEIIPEPASLGLLGFGALLALRRRGRAPAR